MLGFSSVGISTPDVRDYMFVIWFALALAIYTAIHHFVNQH